MKSHKQINTLYRVTVLPLSILGIFLIFLSACNKDKTRPNENVEETMTSGKITILVDNTIQPAIESVLDIFHITQPRAHINQVNATENEIVRALLQDSVEVAVLSRLLTPQEEKHFTQRGITPEITHFGTDAIALVTNRGTNDTIIDLEQVLNILRSEESAVNSIVFDNPNSSTMLHLLRLAGVKAPPGKKVHAAGSNEDVIKYIRSHVGAIGIIGVSWLVEPPQSVQKDVENLTVLAVRSVKTKTGTNYFKPTQSNISTGDYPLTRKLYLLNYQGRQGLGMGFATYINARDGQRIILKTGLLPSDIPTREINVPIE